MAPKIPITLAEGDGIGPEIMAATLHVLDASGADLEIHKVKIGKDVYLAGHPSGIEDSTWETIKNTKAFLKAPITTPQGGGFKSLNVTIRTTLGLYANIRPCIAYAPYVETKHPGMNVIIVRENEEDLYAGIEYRQSADTTFALKIITRSGSEKIIRYAFEYALAHNRKKVTCFTKDNILKLTDGLFHQVYEEIGKEYPDIEKEHWIVDIGAAKLADSPEVFDVVVLPNLYGDILSDVAAQIAGSVGLAGSANIGEHGAMFEAIHGSAPRRAGQDLANPSGLIHASILMLAHLGLGDAAANIHNAWLKTIEDGIHTYDIFEEGRSVKKVGTKEFGEAVAARLGRKPEHFEPVFYNQSSGTLAGNYKGTKTPIGKKELVGVDLFIESNAPLAEIQKKLSALGGELPLKMITNRGTIVWPGSHTETYCSDQWRCRFISDRTSQKAIVSLLKRIVESGVDVLQMQTLYEFDGKAEYSLADV